MEKMDEVQILQTTSCHHHYSLWSQQMRIWDLRH